jgi:hypothetical protein
MPIDQHAAALAHGSKLARRRTRASCRQPHAHPADTAKRVSLGHRAQAARARDAAPRPASSGRRSRGREFWSTAPSLQQLATDEVVGYRTDVQAADADSSAAAALRQHRAGGWSGSGVGLQGRERRGKGEKWWGSLFGGGSRGPPGMEAWRGNLEGPQKWRVI